MAPGSLRAAIDQSIVFLNRIPKESQFLYGTMTYSAQESIVSLKIFLKILDKKLKYDQFLAELQKNFHMFKSSANKEDQVLFTGYYEPIFEGSLKRTKKYNVPVYSLPKDLLVLNLGRFRNSLSNRTIVFRLQNNEVMPYYTRSDIMQKNVLAGKNLEIAWMKDPVDLFFLQIQGSGILALENGKIIKLSYCGSNGHQYSSIGKILVEQEKMKLEEVSMGSIRRYLQNNPSLRDQILHYNNSYTFFEKSHDQEAPKGNINVPLTANRSIATDTRAFPKAGLGYIVSDLPTFPKDWDTPVLMPFSRFVLNQDTGGAIKGPGRVDLFWGNGTRAERSAGVMRSHGSLYFLIAKKDVIRTFIEDQPSK